MLPACWSSERLVYCSFEQDEAALAKSVYDSLMDLESLDPHFGNYPISNFTSHLRNDCTGKERNGKPLFFVRKIVESKTGVCVGYFQVELDAPESRQAWLPMFVLSPPFQSLGYGKECVNDLMSVIQAIGGIDSIGLNVYAENVKAFKFWFEGGWSKIAAIDIEKHSSREFTCVTLLREVV